MINVKYSLILSFLSLIASINAAPEKGPFSFEYKVNKGLAGQLGHVQAARFQFQSFSTEKLVDEPVYFSRVPRYASIRLGDGVGRVFTAVIDESCGTYSGYDTLYIDANNNEDLTDDKKLTCISGAGTKRIEFPVVELMVSYGTQKYPYHVKPYITDGLMLKATGCLTGELSSEDGTVRMALFDSNTNGLFNDKYRFSGRRSSYTDLKFIGDSMHVFEKNPGNNIISSPPVLYYTGTAIPIGSKCFELRIAPHGREVSIIRSAGSWGYLESKVMHSASMLESDKGLIELRNPGTVKVPAGRYEYKKCTFQMKDKTGRMWHIKNNRKLKGVAVDIKAGEKSTLAFGLPLKAEIFITQRLSDEFRFDLKILGQGGEPYSGRYIKPADARAALMPPRFNILDKNNKIVRSGIFKYG